MKPEQTYDGLHEYDDVPDSVNELYADEQQYHEEELPQAND